MTRRRSEAEIQFAAYLMRRTYRELRGLLARYMREGDGKQAAAVEIELQRRRIRDVRG